MDNKITEFFGHSVIEKDTIWEEIVLDQTCPYSSKKCYKTRKSSPDISIGTCTLEYGGEHVIICPNRLLEKKQTFMDCIHLLKKHEPGNELHILPEISIPGGSVDYVLASSKDGEIVDFVGIEFQTMDTTGTIWPERQRLLINFGLIDDDPDADNKKPFGMNWKMTAKTILIQMHHKSETFEKMGKHIVLAIQEPFLEYMQKEFDFSSVTGINDADAVQIHSYELIKRNDQYSIHLKKRLSTTSVGISKCLGLNADSEIDYIKFVELLKSKMSDSTLFTL